SFPDGGLFLGKGAFMKIANLTLLFVCVLMLGILSLSSGQAPKVTLQVFVKGQGTGTVISSPTGIQCIASSDRGCAFELTPIHPACGPRNRPLRANWAGGVVSKGRLPNAWDKPRIADSP